MKIITATFEVDGSKLKQAREARGLAPKELALKVCLSKEHITQLENNQHEIFFTTAHKIQVAKKVGSALGLIETDYLIQQETGDMSSHNAPSPNLSETSIQLPNSTDLFAKANIKTRQAQQPLLIKPSILLFSILSLIGVVVLSNDLSLLNLSQFIKTPSSISASSIPVIEQPIVESSAPELQNPTKIEEPESEVKKLAVNNDQIPCSVQGPEPEIYRTANPSKPGEMVYLLSRERQTVCVIDSQNKSFPLELDAGQSRSVYGKAPFILVSSNLGKFDIYFQGWKVKMLNTEVNAIRLEPTELAQN